MVVWTGRWEDGVGGNEQQQQHQQHLHHPQLHDHVAGLDLPPPSITGGPETSSATPTITRPSQHHYPCLPTPAQDQVQDQVTHKISNVTVHNSVPDTDLSLHLHKNHNHHKDQELPIQRSLCPHLQQQRNHSPQLQQHQHPPWQYQHSPRPQYHPAVSVAGSSNGTAHNSSPSSHSNNNNCYWDNNSSSSSEVQPLTGNRVVPSVNGLSKMQPTIVPAEEIQEEEEEEEDEEELLCGIGPYCSPAWIQQFTNMKVFLVVFCVASVLQGMFYTYFVSVLTTIEKIFQIKSKTTGIIMSATEMGQIGGALLLTYYGGQGHRPKWIGWGMVLFAACAFFCALPHFIFGKQLMQHSFMSLASNASELSSLNTCILPGNDSVLSLLDNSTDGIGEVCHGPDRTTQIVLAIFFLSLLGIGIGMTAVYNLGIPYIDDNVSNRESPIYFAVTSGVRILGPTLGFMLGSLCTSLYVEPFANHGLTPDDPLWIGAWWLGLLVVSAALFCASIFMFAFPRHLPNSPRVSYKKTADKRHSPSLRDFSVAVKRLLKNEILMLRTASSVLHILPIAGLYTFLPKYFESQFRLTTHSANLVSGMGGILVMGIGIFASGVFIRKKKPTARFVTAWIALTAVIYSIGMITLMFVGCSQEKIVGLDESIADFSPLCNRTCGSCDDTSFKPICGSDGKSYFSACHVGCTSVTHKVVPVGPLNETSTNEVIFSNCECMPDINWTAKSNRCELQCNNFIWYIIIFSIFVLVHSTSEVGGMLVTLRCVEPKDKAMALGVIAVAIGLFGNVPCPIIYGSVVDSACIHWKTTCGEPGACELYESDIFRMFFHGVTGGVMILAFFVDVIVWHKSKKVSFNDEEEEDGGVQMKASLSSATSPASTSTSPTTPTTISTVDEGTLMMTEEEPLQSQTSDEQSEVRV
ncbi:unnamed protein product [Meganyctiphanes norvegica]|uniref:Solute carrier organic anion transporter family member n=1 Tax=Meganyctiphanes norvegica TaxID=48144 RepID=A0AAV2R919_MEGNR